MFGIKGYVFKEEGAVRLPISVPPTPEIKNLTDACEFMDFMITKTPGITHYPITLTSAKGE